MKSSSGGRSGARLAIADTQHEKKSLAVTSVQKTGKARDTPSCGPSPEPAADAVPVVQNAVPKMAGLVLSAKEVQAIANFFDGYDEQAEDAAHLLLNRYGGVLIAEMSAKQTQKMGAYMCLKVQYRAVMTGYTYDLLLITGPLCEAAERGVDAIAVLDYGHTMKGTTIHMIERLARLRKAGVKVLLSHGRDPAQQNLAMRRDAHLRVLQLDKCIPREPRSEHSNCPE